VAGCTSRSLYRGVAGLRTRLLPQPSSGRSFPAGPWLAPNPNPCHARGASCRAWGTGFPVSPAAVQALPLGAGSPANVIPMCAKRLASPWPLPACPDGPL